MRNVAPSRKPFECLHSRRGLSRRSLAFAGPLLLIAFASAPAFAQSEKEKALSDKLYQEGLAKMLEGAYSVGCPKLTESQALFPRPGTLFTLAECEAKAGRLGTALGYYREYLILFSEMDPDQQSKQREKQRDKISVAQIEALTKQAPRITIAVTGGAAGLSVSLDGAPVDSSRFGSAISVDPGEHVVTWEGKGVSPSERKVTLPVGAEERIEIKTKGAGSSTAKRPKTSSKGPSGQRIAAYAVGGAGGAMIIVGAITGGLAVGEKSTVDQHCDDTGRGDIWTCDAVGKSAADNGKTLATVSSVMFGLGAAGVVGGVVLFLAEPSAKKKASETGGWVRPAIAVGPSEGFFGVRGAW